MEIIVFTISILTIAIILSASPAFANNFSAKVIEINTALSLISTNNLEAVKIVSYKKVNRHKED